MLVGIFDGRPGPLPPKHPWRESFAAIRVALRAAEKLTGRERTHALVRVCRMFERADGDDAPGWRINAKGDGVRTESAETRAFDKANRAALDREDPTASSAAASLASRWSTSCPRTRSST